MQIRSVRKNALYALFALVLLLSVGFTAAVDKPPLPVTVDIEHGGIMYRLDYSDFLIKRPTFALEGGCYDISILEAALTGDAWRELMVRTTCMDDRGLTIRDTAGPDRFEFYVPAEAFHRDALEYPHGVVATVAVNGHAEVLDPSVLDRLAAGVAAGILPDGIEDRAEFRNLAWRYSAEGWYHRALPVFQATRATAAQRYDLSVPEGVLPMRCWKPCLMCAVSAGGTVVGGTVLAATCATTFGATCIGGAVGVVRLAAGTLVSCADCRDCRRGGGGGTKCPRGYKQCCEDQCCREDDPVPDCGPE